jgi:hypothetical protein
MILEEAFACCTAEMPGPPFGVCDQGIRHRRVKRDEARLIVLGTEYLKEMAIEKDIRAPKAQSLGDPQSGGCEQAKKRNVRVLPKASTWPQAASLTEERRELRLRVDMWLTAAVRSPEEASGRNVRPRVESGQVLGEDAEDFESARKVETVDPRRQRDPPHSEFLREWPAVVARVGVARKCQ